MTFDASELVPDLRKLTPDQYAWVSHLVRSFATPLNATRNPDSDVIPNDKALGLCFLYLVTHHTLSAEPFKKEKFEFAMQQILTQLGRNCILPSSRTNPGLDLVVDGERWSFKSEAHKKIRRDTLLVSKWMELGKGEWTNDPQHLVEQCKRFLHHLEGYDRILVLRCMTPESTEHHEYELLEIPKPLLQRSINGSFEMMMDSSQMPKPGYCSVAEDSGVELYRLYFDGGTERKLQIKSLRREACTFHARWVFDSRPSMQTKQ